MKVSIPQWSHMDGDDNTEATTRESLSASSVTTTTTTRGTVYAPEGSGTSKGGHIEYLIDISHAGDNWFTWKRYTDLNPNYRLV